MHGDMEQRRQRREPRCSTTGHRRAVARPHRSGIGDYLDEDELEDINDYVLIVTVHELATTVQFLALLGGHPMKHERTPSAIRNAITVGRPIAGPGPARPPADAL
jgi:hypothetical protein